MVLEISQFFDFQDGRRPPSWIFNFFKFLITQHVGRSNVHHHAKFDQNQSNGCCDIAFNIFQNGGVRHFGIVRQILGRPTFGGLYHSAKFGWNHFSRFDNTKV